MLQQEKPDDYVVATGHTHSVKEFVKAVFTYLDIDWEQVVSVDPRYYRPTEVDLLLGNATKCREVLGWSPQVNFQELVKMMTEADWELARNERLIQENNQL